MKPQTNIKFGKVLLAVLVAVFSFPQTQFVNGEAFQDALPVKEISKEYQTVQPEHPEVLGAFTDIRHDEVKDISAPIEPLPNLDAKAILAYQPDSGSVLVSKNADLELPIASITKLMTALVALDSPEFNTPIVITKADQISVAPALKLKVGDTVEPIDLVKSMIVGSANDAAVTLANHFPDSNTFVSLMNAKAQELGMSHTHFSNPMGFDSEYNFSSAADLSILVREAMKKLPYDEIWKKNNYSFSSEQGNIYRIQNSNDLVYTHRNIKSIKTGSTPLSLQSMISFVKDENTKPIVAIILNSTDRNSETLRLVDYVYKNFNLQ